MVLLPRDDGRSIKRLNAGASTAMELHTAVSQIKSNQPRQVTESNDEGTDTKAEQDADRDWLSFVFTRSFTQNILIHQHQKSQPVRQTLTQSLTHSILVHPATDHYVHYY